MSDEWKGAARIIALYPTVPRVDLRDQGEEEEDSDILLTLYQKMIIREKLARLP